MLVILAALPLVDPHLDVQVDFAREVRPILAARCFACHGPDEAARKAHLRLDLEDQALLVIDRENHAESELLQRLRAEPAKRMPPQGEEPLTLDELEVLERWLRQRPGVRTGPSSPRARPRCRTPQPGAADRSTPLSRRGSRKRGCALRRRRSDTRCCAGSRWT